MLGAHRACVKSSKEIRKTCFQPWSLHFPTSTLPRRSRWPSPWGFSWVWSEDRAQKAVGVRTFAIIALLGTLTYLVAPQLLIVPFCGTFLLVILLNIHHLIKDWPRTTADAAAPRKAARESAYAVDRDAPLE